jgi:protocatechuate 3,4-dioxygenase beta subunit
MSTPINRRRALATLGALGTGVVLGACASDDPPDSTAGSTMTTTGGDGSTTTTATAGTGGLASRFEEATTCELTRELTEGPYYIDVESLRSDIREDRDGQALRLGIRVLDASCEPITDAIVEIWHCDAVGTYSGVEGDESTFLRGGQVTDAEGIVEFVTVYPGWYRGRTVHIHSKLHVNNREVLTTQLFFDESVTEDVYQGEPYASDTGRDTFNDDDNIFDASLVVTTTNQGDGYLGLVTFVAS